MDVRFLKGTKAGYEALVPVATTFYYLTDTNQLFLGNIELSNKATSDQIAALAARVTTNEGDIDTLQSILSSFLDGGADAVKNAIDAVKTQVNGLANVARTGTAADVTVADAGGNLDATNVEDALTEILGKVAAAQTAGAVTVAKTTGGAQDNFATEYVFSQGGVPITNGTITIGKDLVATAGELVNQDGEGHSGTFIKMTIANGTPFYINVTDLIEYNSVTSTNEVTLTDNNHTISATIGEIAASKIIYKTAAETGGSAQTVAQAINALETAASTGVDDKIAAAVADLDSDVTVANHKIITAIYQVDGKLNSVDTEVLDANYVSWTPTAAGEQKTTVANGLDIAMSRIAGEASAARAAEKANADAAAAAQADVDVLETYVGTIPATATATNVVAYVDEKTGAGVSALNGTAGIASVSDDVVTLKAGVVETAGVISNSTDADITLAKVAKTGAAVDVNVAAVSGLQADNVQDAIAEIVNQLTWGSFPSSGGNF